MSASDRRETIAQAASELFAQRGYQRASIEKIARQAGVTPPVIYDHFASKQILYQELLEDHFAQLRRIWQEHFTGDEPLKQRMVRSFEAWFAYVETNPFAGRMLFRDTTGDPTIAAMHAEVAARSRAALMPLLAAEPEAPDLGFGDTATELVLDMVWEVLRGVLQSLAVWWYDHLDVPRDQVVAVAVNILWPGIERVRQGKGRRS